jgi:hypothetical protein
MFAVLDTKVPNDRVSGLFLETRADARMNDGFLEIVV